MHNDVYIVDALRTPVGSFGGSLANFSAVKLGEFVVRRLIEKNNLNPEEIDEVIMGNVLQAGLGQNVARQIEINSGIPNDKTALTINMVCGSGLRSIALAAQAIKAHDAKIIIAGGSESMSNAAYILKNARFGYKMGNANIIDSMINDGLWDAFNDYHMGITAENLAQKYNISRKQQDEFAVASQNKAEKAIKEGKFKDEIVPIEIPQKKKEVLKFDTDEYPKFGSTYEKISMLKPAFKKDGTVTAANASGINDGAAALIVADSQTVKKINCTPMARIVSYACAGVDPKVMGIGPVEAVKKALDKAGWTVSDLDLIEANEAFAVQALSVAKELLLPLDKTNVNGGAIAIGHPIGASGARIMTTLLHEMRRRDAKKGLATVCIGGGMGIAMCVER